MAKGPPSSRDRAGIAIGRRLQDVDLTQADLVRILKKSQSWVSQVLLDQADKTLRRLYVNDPELLIRLMEALKWTPEQFAQETGVGFVVQVAEVAPGARLRDSAVPAELVRVPFRGVASAGAAPDPDAVIEIPRKLARVGVAVYVVDGESMLPNLDDGDSVLVDESVTTLRNNAVFAIRPGGNGVQIRRCMILRSLGRTVFVPDNEGYPEYDLEEDDVEVLGHVYSILEARPVI